MVSLDFTSVSPEKQPNTLSIAEQTTLAEHERVIERGLKTFYEVGNALIYIRDNRLYRANYATFEDYCLRRWSLQRRRAYQLMDSSLVFDNVKNFTHLPANEAQVQPLVSLEPTEQKLVWDVVQKTAVNGKVTAAHVKSVVDVLKEVTRTQAIDDGTGEQVEVSKIFEQAVTEETYERMMRQKAKIAAREERDERRKRIESASVVNVVVKGEPVTTYKTGDIVSIGSHILICGDNTSSDVKAEIAKHTPYALAFCDPPYNAGVAEWDSGTFAWEQDYLIDTADIVAVTPGIGNIPDFMRRTMMPYKWSTSTTITNGMTRGALGFGNWIYTALFSKQKSIHRNAQDIYSITINASDADELGAKRQKPPMYLSWLFNLLTEEGETILDVFGGSGVSVLIADKLKRRCICIEKDESTFNALVARIENTLDLKAAIQS